MARRSRGNFRLATGSAERAAVEAERERAAHMVAQFDRKGINNTHWHKTLVRLDAVLRELVKEEDHGK